MLYKSIRILFIIISSLLMVRFSLSKLQGLPNVVKSFEQFTETIPLNPTFFMYFTGVTELLIALLLLSSLFIKAKAFKYNTRLVGYLFLLATMIASILIEQFVRPAPNPMLMTIALILLTISISEISIVCKEKKEYKE